jgi:hypothetical protein
MMTAKLVMFEIAVICKQSSCNQSRFEDLHSCSEPIDRPLQRGWSAVMKADDLTGSINDSLCSLNGSQLVFPVRPTAQEF